MNHWIHLFIHFIHQIVVSWMLFRGYWSGLLLIVLEIVFSLCLSAFWSSNSKLPFTKSFLVLLCSNLFTFLIILLIGPSLYFQHFHNVTLAFSLSLFLNNLSSFPIIYSVPPSQWKHFTTTLNPSTLSLAACWLSAFVYPLDWNANWQTFPFPSVTLAFLAYSLTFFILMAKPLKSLTSVELYYTNKSYQQTKRSS